MSKKRDNYNKNLSPMVLPKETLDYLMSQPDCLELIPVYVFYYYYSLWTSKRVTVKLITRKLKMGRDRVRRCKRRLLEIGLLTQTVSSDNDQDRINQQVVIHCSPHWPSGGLPTRPSWPSGGTRII